MRDVVMAFKRGASFLYNFVYGYGTKGTVAKKKKIRS